MFQGRDRGFRKGKKVTEDNESRSKLARSRQTLTLPRGRPEPGQWPRTQILWDKPYVDANAPSYQRSSWDAIARKAAEAKRKKYAQASEDLRSSFTPLVCSTDAVLHREYMAYQKRLASRLATKWDKWSPTRSWWPGSGCRPSSQSSAPLISVFVGHVAALWAWHCKMVQVLALATNFL